MKFRLYKNKQNKTSRNIQSNRTFDRLSKRQEMRFSFSSIDINIVHVHVALLQFSRYYV